MKSDSESDKSESIYIFYRIILCPHFFPNSTLINPLDTIHLSQKRRCGHFSRVYSIRPFRAASCIPLHWRHCFFMSSPRAEEVNKPLGRENEHKERNLSQIWRKGLAGGLAGCAVRMFGMSQERFANTNIHAG